MIIIPTRSPRVRVELAALKQHTTIGDVPPQLLRLIEHHRPKLERWLSRLDVDVNVIFTPSTMIPVNAEGRRLKGILERESSPGAKLGSSRAINLVVISFSNVKRFPEFLGTPPVPPTAWTVMHRLAHNIEGDRLYGGAIFRKFWSAMRSIYGIRPDHTDTRKGYWIHYQTDSRSSSAKRIEIYDGTEAISLPDIALTGQIANQLFDFRSARNKDVSSTELIYELIAHTMVTGYKPRMKLPTHLEIPYLEDKVGVPSLAMRVSKSDAEALRKDVLRFTIARTKMRLKELVGKYIV